MSRALAAAVVVVCAASSACGVSPDRSVEDYGRYAVGTQAASFTDAARGRTVAVQLWYPVDGAPAADTSIDMIEGAHQPAYAALLAAAPAGCPTHALPAAAAAPPAAGRFPLIAFSHCHACSRMSGATLAARLASHGFVVVAVDHAGDTIWDHQAGMDANLDSAELLVREGDVRFALDRVLAGDAAVPPAVAVAIDPAHVGVVGHSFGGVTAGMVAQDDPRIGAAAALASPMDNPLIEGVHIDQLHVPLFFLVAVEDNSITEIGNKFIRSNFTSATVPVWKHEVADAGHWSFSDFDGLADIFMPGCGAGQRQTDGTPFTYLDPTVGRDTAAADVTAFFRATLLGDAGARAYLDEAGEHRN